MASNRDNILVPLLASLLGEALNDLAKARTELDAIPLLKRPVGACFSVAAAKGTVEAVKGQLVKMMEPT